MMLKERNENEEYTRQAQVDKKTFEVKEVVTTVGERIKEIEEKEKEAQKAVDKLDKLINESEEI